MFLFQNQKKDTKEEDTLWYIITYVDQIFFKIIMDHGTNANGHGNNIV